MFYHIVFALSTFSAGGENRSKARGDLLRQGFFCQTDNQTDKPALGAPARARRAH
jgi:hypothetical protein